MRVKGPEQVKPLQHRLKFSVGLSGGRQTLQFETQETIAGTRNSYDIQDGDLSGLTSFEFRNRFLPTEELEVFVSQDVLPWLRRLRLNLREFFIQFVPERPFGGGFLGRGVCTANRRALLVMEFTNWMPGHLALEVPDDVSTIVPHELMHIRDVLDGLSPAMYPAALPAQGAWIDLLRHLWIDGYLEQNGLPGMKKATRLAELEVGPYQNAEKPSSKQLENVVEEWWGNPMTLKQAIDLGLRLGFPLESNCPIADWYANAR